ncbi:hypothetical protein EDB89DRAFT_2066574 [Lactarius sanguifluus]|nr:hypothetical protein EDB89DRAFT_2066574 [Lactarius sanguifluus]
MGLVSSFTVWVAAGMVHDSTQEYIKASEKHEDPLEYARICCYLYEGMVKWYMPVMIIAISVLAHIAASLFLTGIVIFLFHSEGRASGISVTIIISAISALYVVFTIAPIYYPEFPYRTLLSRTVWLPYQVTHSQTYQDCGHGGEQTRISTDVEEGHMQVLANGSDESDDRTKPDAGAIRSVVDDLTYLEGIKLEPFVLGAPSSFNSNRDKQVREVVTADGDNRGSMGGACTLQPNEVKELALVVTCFVSKPWWFSPTLTQHDNTTEGLSSLITRLLKMCTDPSVWPTEEARRKHSHACIDTALSFVLAVGDDWEWFPEPKVMSQVLTYLGNVERIREPTTPGFDMAFAACWTCVALVAVRRMLNTQAVRTAAQHIITCLAEELGRKGLDGDEVAAKTTKITDLHLKRGWAAAHILHTALNREVEHDKMEELFLETLADPPTIVAIKDLRDAWNSLDWADKTDEAITNLVETMLSTTGGILSYLPTAVLPWAPDSRSASGSSDRICTAPLHLIPHFLPPQFLTRRLWLCVSALERFEARGWSDSDKPNALGDLCAPELDVPEIRRVFHDNSTGPMEAQLWRLQDLRNGGFVFMLELFMATSLTSDWKGHRDAPGTQRLLVYLLRQVLPKSKEAPAEDVPAYIVDKFLTFIGEVLAGKEGDHASVTDALQLIREFVELHGGTHAVAQDALLTISQSHSLSLF